jgi:hypothetical protein
VAAEGISLARDPVTSPARTGGGAGSLLADTDTACSPVVDAASRTSLVTYGNKSIRGPRCRAIPLWNRATRRYLGVRCGRYSCEVCANVNRRRFVRRVLLGLSPFATFSDRPRFLTLTMPPGVEGGAAWSTVGYRFEKLRQRIKVRFGVKLEYAGVVESTAAGVPHLHVVFRGPWVAQREWSVMAQASGFGRVVDIRAVTSGGVASYAGKSLGNYLSKSLAHRYPSHFRRVRFSRGWSPEWVRRPPRAATTAAGGRWEVIQPRTAEWYSWLAWRAGQEALEGAGQGRFVSGAAGPDP